MSISDNYTPTKNQGDGVTTSYAASWSVFNEDYLSVIFEDTATGAQTIQTSGFTVVVETSLVTVTFDVAPASTVYVILSRNIPLEQQTPYKTSRGFQGNSIETSLDLLTAITQDLEDEILRAPKSPVGSDPLVLPPYEAGLNVGWSATENNTLVNGEKTTAEIDAAVDLVDTLSAQSGVKVSANDTTVGFLSTKFIAGDALTSQINNPNLDETFTVSLEDGGVTTSKIADDGVTTDKILDNNVTFVKIDSSDIATQPEAEAGTADDKLMTPERTAQAISALTSAGYTFLTSQSATGIFVTFSGIPDSAEEIVVSFEGVSFSGSDNALLRLGDSGGIETSGYDSRSAVFSGTSQAETTSTSGMVSFFGGGSNTVSGFYTLQLIDASSNLWQASGSFARNNGVLFMSGEKSLSDSISQLSIVGSSGGGFDSGTIHVKYR